MSFDANPPAVPAPAVEAPAAFLGIGGINPAPGPNRTRTWSRNLECAWLAGQAGPRAYPGVIEPPRPRGDYIEQYTMVCRERALRLGLRDPIDEAILSTMQGTTLDLVERAANVDPALAARTWLVEVFVPSAAVAYKVSFAAKNALVGRGLSVSDRAPTLSATDVDVLVGLPATEAYPSACARYALDDGDVLLAMMLLDPRETSLHAGLCVDGGWMWLP